MRISLQLVLAALALMLAGFPSALSATYLDPGTGSFIAQLVAAVVLGGLASLRSVREKVAGWFGRLLPDRPEGESERDEPG